MPDGGGQVRIKRVQASKVNHVPDIARKGHGQGLLLALSFCLVLTG